MKITNGIDENVSIYKTNNNDDQEGGEDYKKQSLEDQRKEQEVKAQKVDEVITLCMRPVKPMKDNRIDCQLTYVENIMEPFENLLPKLARLIM